MMFFSPAPSTYIIIILIWQSVSNLSSFSTFTQEEIFSERIKVQNQNDSNQVVCSKSVDKFDKQHLFGFSFLSYSVNKLLFALHVITK